MLALHWTYASMSVTPNEREAGAGRSAGLSVLLRFPYSREFHRLILANAEVGGARESREEAGERFSGAGGGWAKDIPGMDWY